MQPGNNAELMTQHVADVMDGKADESTLTTEEQSYYESAQRFLEAEEAGEKADSADYSQYMSRMVSIFKMIEEPANFLVPSFFETTDSMGSRWSSLEKMEMETVLKIITVKRIFPSSTALWNSGRAPAVTGSPKKSTRPSPSNAARIAFVKK